MPAPPIWIASIPPEVGPDLVVGMDQIALAPVVIFGDRGCAVSGLLDELMIVLVGDKVAVDRVSPERQPLSRQFTVEPSIALRHLPVDPIGIGPLLGIAPHPEKTGRDDSQSIVAS